uniref:Uncharacterized protein n=1 Tax=Anopheles atroparvus TaxID=41427 RepID=A0A182JJL4_ANOAO
MMRYEGNEELADKSACAGVRADLKMCLLQSDCCKKESLLATLLRERSLKLAVVVVGCGKGTFSNWPSVRSLITFCDAITSNNA